MLSVIFLLLKNQNQDDIKQSLNSLSLIKGKKEVLIGYCSPSTPDTIDCQAIFISVPPHQGNALNQLVKSSSGEYILWLKPGETLVRPIADYAEKGNFQIVQPELSFRECRLWSRFIDVRFSNPIFPHHNILGNNFLGEILSNDDKIPLEIVEQWSNSSPCQPEPLYYLSCSLLAEKQYDRFLQIASQFVFSADSKQFARQIGLIYHYAGKVHLLKRNLRIAQEFAAAALSCHPLMAEFWCLAGDIQFYGFQQYHRAKTLYEDAIEIGRNRRLDDGWPIEFGKYGEYPQKMIQQCSRIIKSSHFTARMTNPIH